MAEYKNNLETKTRSQCILREENRNKKPIKIKPFCQISKHTTKINKKLI